MKHQYKFELYVTVMTHRIITTILLSLTLFISFAQTTIKLKKDGNLYKIPCNIDGVDMDFIFDTGASSVTISLTEALFLLKNGNLKKTDIIGKTRMAIANGDIVEGTIVLIRQIKIGNLRLKDVEATITNTLNAPLLLGQSAIEKFGTFTFDYQKQTITVKVKEENNEYIIDESNPIVEAYKKTIGDDVYKKQVAEWKAYAKVKEEIYPYLSATLYKLKTRVSEDNTYISFDFEVTNDSEIDFLFNKQFFKYFRLYVTIFTEEGRNYGANCFIMDIPAHGATSQIYLPEINVRTNKVTGVKFRILNTN